MDDRERKGFEVMWAPWRLEYILGPKPGGCFLCDLAPLDPSPENLLLAKTDRALVVLNRFPYNNGHLLVAPRAHLSDLSALHRPDYAHLMEVFRFSVAALKKAFAPEGVNGGINLGKSAGAGLEEHLHLHLVPRWNGDTNFMPVVAGTRVIPQALADTHRALAPLFARLAEETR